MTTYFTATYSIKRFTTTLGSVLLTCGVLLVVFMAIQPQDLTLFIGYYVGLVFAVAGIWLLLTAAKAKITRLSVSSEGLSYGPQSYSWDQIAEFGVMPGRKEFYCTPRSAPFGLEFPISHRPSVEQTRNLFDLLKREIVPRHPHVRFCNDDKNSKC